jgi:hypothetical protein
MNHRKSFPALWDLRLQSLALGPQQGAFDCPPVECLCYDTSDTTTLGSARHTSVALLPKRDGSGKIWDLPDLKLLVSTPV